MWGLFSSLPKPYKKLNEPSTEGWCNRLHYRVTVIFFLGCSILVTCLEWVGNGSKISCVMEGTHMRFDSNCLTILILKAVCFYYFLGPVDSWTIPQNVINTYCFVLKTFTLPKHWNSKVGYESAHRGVGDFVPGRGEENPGDDVTYQAYYQWVPFVLFFQVCLDKNCDSTFLLPTFMLYFNICIRSHPLIFESGDIALHTFQIFIPVWNVTEYANFDFTANMHTLFRSNSFVK